mmetsp:Transcript_17681/g.38387  ORF Transcript_17681/g.38387 Transcript_17681/m.38387 type:complete len:331 (+) Transcript_17681:887-1879(+)
MLAKCIWQVVGPAVPEMPSAASYSPCLWLRRSATFTQSVSPRRRLPLSAAPPTPPRLCLWQTMPLLSRNKSDNTTSPERPVRWGRYLSPTATPPPRRRISSKLCRFSRVSPTNGARRRCVSFCRKFIRRVDSQPCTWSRLSTPVGKGKTNTDKQTPLPNWQLFILLSETSATPPNVFGNVSPPEEKLATRRGPISQSNNYNSWANAPATGVVLRRLCLRLATGSCQVNSQHDNPPPTPPLHRRGGCSRAMAMRGGRGGPTRVHPWTRCCSVPRRPKPVVTTAPESLCCSRRPATVRLLATWSGAQLATTDSPDSCTRVATQRAVTPSSRR